MTFEEAYAHSPVGMVVRLGTRSVVVAHAHEEPVEDGGEEIMVFDGTVWTYEVSISEGLLSGQEFHTADRDAFFSVVSVKKDWQPLMHALL